MNFESDTWMWGVALLGLGSAAFLWSLSRRSAARWDEHEVLPDVAQWGALLVALGMVGLLRTLLFAPGPRGDGQSIFWVLSIISGVILLGVRGVVRRR